MSNTPTIQEMFSKMSHGGLGFTAVYFDKQLGTIDTSLGEFHKKPEEGNKKFLKRVKKAVAKEAEGSIDTIIVVHN